VETEIDKIKDDGKIDRETNLDCRGPRQIGTVRRIPDPQFSHCPLPLKLDCIIFRIDPNYWKDIGFFLFLKQKECQDFTYFPAGQF
jgi:hypothetical protein